MGGRPARFVGFLQSRRVAPTHTSSAVGALVDVGGIVSGRLGVRETANLLVCPDGQVVYRQQNEVAVSSVSWGVL